MHTDKTIEIAFGKLIKEHRQMLCISQEKLAELAGLHRTYISQIERGLKSPSLKSLMTLATALNTKAYILLRKIEDTNE